MLSVRTFRLMALGAAACLMSGVSHADYSTGFEGGLPAGWTSINLSTVVGSVPQWVPGSVSAFPAKAGTPGSYMAASNLNTYASGTISNWLISPTITLNSGDVVSFFARGSGSGFADRLQLRISVGGGTDVGITSESVGNFSLLAYDINPKLDDYGFPSQWTEYSFKINPMQQPTPVSFGFRYFVYDGGPAGTRSDYIGIDEFSVTSPSVTPVPEPQTWVLMGLGLGAVLLRRQRTR